MRINTKKCNKFNADIGYLQHCHFKRLKLLIEYINRLQKAEQEDTHKRSPSSILVKVIPFTHKTNIL